jgi:arginine utilization protein RocB
MNDSSIPDFAALRAAIEVHDTSSTSTSTSPSSLALFLHIYSKSAHEAYIHHHRGAIELIEYLYPIDMAAAVAQYPEASNPNFKVPTLLSGYSSSELAKLLNRCYPEYSYQVISNLIYFIMSKEIIMELY